MASGTVGLMSFLSTRCTSRLKFIKSSSSILVIFTLFITWILRGSPTVTIWTLIVNYYYDLKSCSRLLNLRSQMKPSDSHRNPHWSLVAFFTSLRCAEIRAGIMLWNDISQCETTPRSAWKKKKLSKKVQSEYSGVSISPRFTSGSNKWSHRRRRGALPHYGEQLLIFCQNIFKIWTALSLLWRADLSVGLVTGGVTPRSSNTPGSFHSSAWHVKCDATKRLHFNCLDRSLKREGLWFWVLTE